MKTWGLRGTRGLTPEKSSTAPGYMQVCACFFQMLVNSSETISFLSVKIMVATFVIAKLIIITNQKSSFFLK